MPLPLSDFDAILGMDGLSRYKANVDCFKRKVIFEKEDGVKVCFMGDSRKATTKIVSAMTAMKYLRKGYDAYLAFVVDKRKEGKELKEVPTVREFGDVFPEELPGLPPEREIEFEIELLLGVSPISQAPYRMDPMELKELKV